jgi:hypothetical protein
MAEGVKVAGCIIDGGEALKKLDLLVKATNQ